MSYFLKELFIFYLTVKAFLKMVDKNKTKYQYNLEQTKIFHQIKFSKLAFHQRPDS
jgi:hypothetical protein